MLSKLRNINSPLIWVYSCVFFIILSTHPFYFWNLNNSFLILGFLVFGLWERPPKSIRILSLALFFLFYLCAGFNQYVENTLIRRIVLFFTLFLPFSLFFVGERFWKEIFNRYLFLYTISLIPSLIVYFYVYWLGLDLPHTTIDPLNSLKEESYLQYPFLVMLDKFAYMRFCGYYDEPGVIGTISGSLLFVNQYNMKDWKNWPLLISGIFSFSLFFYALILIYVLFFGSVKLKVLISLLAVSIVFFLTIDDSVFSELILSRLEYDDGAISGNNRESLDLWKYVGSLNYYIGYGFGYSDLVADVGGASYKHLILDFGVIMFVVYLLAMILYYFSFHLPLKYTLLLIVLFVCILYQRPGITSQFCLFLMIAPASILKINLSKLNRTSK